MATLPAFRTWVAGEVVTAAFMNSNIRDGGNYFLAQPLASLRQNVVQSVPNNAWTAITFDTEDLDTDNGHSTSTNTSRYVAATAGWHLCTYDLSFVGNVTGRRGGRMRMNGADTGVGFGMGRVLMNTSSAFDAAVCGSGLLQFNGTTDYVELMGFQDSGGALNTNIAVDAAPRLLVFWIHT